jgi:hypothetical protein
MKKIVISFLLSFAVVPLIAQTSSTDTLWCANTPVYFQHDCWQEQPGIQFLHVHENEKTAVEATRSVLAGAGHGCFVTWQAQDDRYVSFDINGKHYKIDPNRIYSARGLEATLKKNGDYSKEAFDKAQLLAKAFLEKYIHDKKLLVAVHNNTEGDLTAHSFVKGGETKASYINKERDQDDFFLTTDPWIFEYLKKRKFNIVLQKQGIADDGSLSVYAAHKKIPYLNIEAQHGHLEEQKEMLQIVMQMIDERFQ